MNIVEFTLRASEDNCFFEIFYHKGETAGSETHRICTVSDDEGVEYYFGDAIRS